MTLDSKLTSIYNQLDAVLFQAARPPIVDQKLWDDVHAILATSGRTRGKTTRAPLPFLLKSLVFGNDGRALSPWSTTKKKNRRCC